ncbi:helix-turn-helix transcriptional regulator [Hamadaea sp. NPDC051192]|uniref:helix-turn-helix domain-containing protein n=1 Tax=Hamadaea sp. NPDC051192 TaxID=3154940 RepID=UPI00342BCB08
MPRKKKPIDPTLTGPVVEFAQELREFRERAGSPSYAAMYNSGHMSVSNLSTADQGKTLPTPDTVRSYIKGCGGSDDDVRRMQARRAQIQGLLSGEPPSPEGRGRRRRGTVVELPDPYGIETLPGLLDHLKQIKEWAGKPTFKELAERAETAGLSLRPSTAGDMLTKDRLPKMDTMAAFLHVCGVPEDHQAVLVSIHQDLARARVQSRLRLSARLAKEDLALPVPPDHTWPEPDDESEPGVVEPTLPVMRETTTTQAATAESLTRMASESGPFRAMGETDAFVRDIGTSEWERIDPAYPRQWPADPQAHPTWAQRGVQVTGSTEDDWSPEKVAAVDALNAEADRVLIEMGELRLLRPGIRKVVPIPRRPEATYRVPLDRLYSGTLTQMARAKTTASTGPARTQYRPKLPNPPLGKAHRPRHQRGIFGQKVKTADRSSTPPAAATTDRTDSWAVLQQAKLAAADPWDAWADPPGGGLATRSWEGSVAGKVFTAVAVMLAVGCLAFFAMDRTAQATNPADNAATSSTSPDPQVFAELAVLWDQMRRELHGLPPTP